MVKTINLNDLQNKEKYVCELLGKMTGRRTLQAVDINEKGDISFQFSDKRDEHARAVVKQFSKDKYESLEAAIFQFRKIAPKYSTERGLYKLVVILDYPKEWLAIFSQKR